MTKSIETSNAWEKHSIIVLRYVSDSTGALIALVIYLWLGLIFLSKTWFNLAIVGAISLILVGLFGIFSAHAGRH